ncbi:MAG: DNA polymerase IV [Chloroflexota bacterium]|nr:MAG: DNA polymerase IV [Chloroflexota bacterium]
MAGTSESPACILYVDADRFFFSVEAIEQPGLADDPRPVIISQDPREAPRAVVTTANDAARRLGINSAMSAAMALRRAPDAVFLPPRHELYVAHSRRLMALLREESPLVQQNSIDEAACDWRHRGFDPTAATALRERVLAELRLSITLGIATSPLVGKIASESAKSDPTHLRVVPPGTEAAFLNPLPIRALVGVGPKSERRLLAAGIDTIGALASRTLVELIASHGQAYGTYLHRASHGEADATLSEERVAKSVSAERTFSEDTADRRRLWREIQEQADEISERLRKENLLAGEVAIKIRYGNWQTLTRQSRLSIPSNAATTVATVAANLMRLHWDRTRPLRLLGVRAGRLVSAAEAQPSLPLTIESDVA